MFFCLMVVIVLGAPHFISTVKGWSDLSGPLLLVFGLLTLVNAPFDWFAIGLTRALLRRGLAPSGPGPYVFALIDFLVAVVTITILACVTVVAVQSFDDIAVLRGGPAARILPLGPLFDGLETRPGDPEFWWIWLMLFSTLIPSLLNLMIGAAAFLRGLPAVNGWILDHMPDGVALPERERGLVAAALAGQIVGGALITALSFDLLVRYLVPLGLPTIGGFVRDLAEQVAAFNAPARLMMGFAGDR
jgi:hypothetical protein